MKHRAPITRIILAFAGLWLFVVFAHTAPAQAAEPTPPPLHAPDSPTKTQLPMQLSLNGRAPFLNVEQVPLPDALTQAVLVALQKQLISQRVQNPLRDSARYVLTSARLEGNWAFISVGALDDATSVPGYVGSGEAGQLMVGHRVNSVNGDWELGIEGTPEFATLIAATPDALVNPQAKSLLLQTPNSNSNSPEIITPTVIYKWPWPATSKFYWWQGWHTRSALDMGTLRTDRRVLASAGGVVRFMCKGKLGAAIKIKDADGVTLEYWHIDTKLLDPDVKEGALLVQGQILGSLRPGTWVDPTCGNQFTQQSATNSHLHWNLPNDRPITIDGWTSRQPQSVFTNGTQKRTCVGSCFRSYVSFDSSNVAFSGPPQIRLSPDVSLASRGEVITLAVSISNAQNLGALQFGLAYSPSQLSVQNIVLAGWAGGVLTPVISLTAGTAVFSTSSALISSTGTSPLAYIAVRANTVGTATLKISAAQTTHISSTLTQNAVLTIVPGCPGDYDRDSDVDVLDVQRVAYRWELQTSDVAFDPTVDTDGDGRINQHDLQRVANRLGTLCAAPPRAHTAEVAEPQIASQLIALSSTVAAGDVFTVGLVISDVASLGAFDLSLSYSATQFEVISVDTMDFATSTGRNQVQLDWVTHTHSLSNVTHSAVHFGAYSLGAWPIGPNGSGTLVEFTLRALSAGEGDLRLTRLQLSDVAGQPQVASSSALSLRVMDAAPELTPQVYLPVLMSDELLPSLNLHQHLSQPSLRVHRTLSNKNVRLCTARGDATS